MAKLASGFFNSKCASDSNECKAKDSSTWSQIRTENIPNDFTGSVCDNASPLSRTPLTSTTYTELISSFPAAALLGVCLIILLLIGFLNLKRSTMHSRLKTLCKKFTDLRRGLLACGDCAKAVSERDADSLCREILAQEKLAKRLRTVEGKLMAVEDIVVYVLDQLSSQRSPQPPAPSLHCKYTCCQCRDLSNTGSPFTEYGPENPVQRTTVRRREY